MYMRSIVFKIISFDYWSTEKINPNYYIDQLPFETFGLNSCQPNFDLESCELRSQIRSQILTYLSQILASFDLIFDLKYWCNPKYWPNSAICCALCFQTLSSHGLKIFNLFGVKLRKSIFGFDAIPNTELKLAICCVLCFHTTSTQWLCILNLFGVMLAKSVFGIEAIPNTDLNWRYAECCVFIHAQPKDSKKWFYSVMYF